MSKFIQFNVQTSGAVQPAEPIAPLLINVEELPRPQLLGKSSFVFNRRYARAAAGAGVSGQILTLTFSTSTSAAAIPALVDGQPNPFVQALVAAMSQDVPGVAVYQLGNDQSTAAAAPNGVQMYIRSAVLS